jgi:hypothetical protein
MRTYQEHYERYKRMHHGKPSVQLDFALNDCHSALKANSHRDSKDPYVVKIWAEIDAIRDLYLTRNKKKA